MSRFPIAGPWVTELEEQYVLEAARHGWYDQAGVWPARFEREFAAHVGRRHAASLPSATSGLHLCLAALGIGPGDEVVVPDATWIATAAPISYVGATPVFADIDPGNWCLSAESLRQCVTSRTRAVIVVDLYGCMPDWERILSVASDAGIFVIEDAAEAVGASWSGRPAGSFGLASVFSFHGSKTVTTGEGGMMVSDDDQLMARADVLRDHGRRPGDVAFFNHEVAFKYKMSALQAAFGCAQLARVDEIVQRKRAIFSWYQQRLADLPGLTLNPQPEGVENSYWMVTAIFEGVAKGSLGEDLARYGVATRPFFHPLSDLPAYASMDQADRARRRNHVVRAISPHGVNLPSALSLTEDHVDEVCHILHKVLAS